MANSEELQSEGRFYVDLEVCLAHEACVDVAPAFFEIRDSPWGAFVVIQPVTAEDVAQVYRAMEECPVAAIRDRESSHGMFGPS